MRLGFLLANLAQNPQNRVYICLNGKLFELKALKVILHYARLKDIWGHKLYRSYV